MSPESPRPCPGEESSAPHEAAPDAAPDAAPLVNPFRRTGRLCRRLLLLVIALTASGAAAVYLLTGQPLWVLIPLLPGVCATLILAVVAAVVPVYARQADRVLEDFRQGRYLAHWAYEPDVWRRFSEAEWRRSLRLAPAFGLLFASLFGIFSLVMWLSGKASPAAVATAAGGGIGLGAVVCLGMILRGWFARRRALRGPGEVYIGPEALYANGAYHTWTGMGLGLERIDLAAGDPPVLTFIIKSGRNSKEVRIPVPAGREDEARAFTRALGPTP